MVHLGPLQPLAPGSVGTIEFPFQAIPEMETPIYQ